MQHQSLSPLTAMRRILFDERTRFVAVGAWNTLVGYLLFAAVHYLAGSVLHPAGTLTVSYCFALPHAFLTQRLLVFHRQKAPWRSQFLRFSLTNSILFLANLALLHFAVARWDGNPVLAQGVVLMVLTVASYFAHKFFSFAGHK